MLKARLCFIACGLVACQQQAKAPPPAPVRIGHVDQVQGTPLIVRSGAKLPAVQVGQELLSGDQLQTDAQSKIRAVFDDTSMLALGNATQATLAQLETKPGRTAKFTIRGGKFWLAFAKSKAGEPAPQLELTLPSATVNGSGGTLWGDTQRDTVCSLDGAAQVRASTATDAAPLQLSTGHCAALMAQGKPTDAMLTAPNVQMYLDEVYIH